MNRYERAVAAGQVAAIPATSRVGKVVYRAEDLEPGDWFRYFKGINWVEYRTDKPRGTMGCCMDKGTLLQEQREGPNASRGWSDVDEDITKGAVILSGPDDLDTWNNCTERP